VVVGRTFYSMKLFMRHLDEFHKTNKEICLDTGIINNNNCKNSVYIRPNMPKLNVVDNARLTDDRQSFDDFNNEYNDDYDVNDDEDKNGEIKSQVKEKCF
jgi:hypothetical protein